MLGQIVRKSQLRSCYIGSSLYQTCQPRAMSTLTAGDIAPPPIDRDMRVLDRSFFRRSIPVSVLSVSEPSNIQLVRSKVTSTRDLLSTTTIRPVVDDDTRPGSKCILLRPHVKADDPSTWNPAWAKLLEEGTASIRPYELKLSYDDWSMSDILDAILPELDSNDEQNPSGFAQVLLDKNPQVKTVINKLHDVGTESAFRTFPYEVLAGSDDLNVTVRHANCDFKFNFAEVYWNTRNGHEHERLLERFEPGQVLCDVTAGVGPFAIPAAKKRVWTWANDLNPACYEGLTLAAKTNKVAEFVRVFNLDGAAFIRDACQKLLQSQRKFEQRPKLKVSRNATAAEKEQAAKAAEAQTVMITEPRTFDHFVMNLPATGIEFLRAFRGVYRGQEGLFTSGQGSRQLPMIHLYTFQARKDDEEEEKAELLQRLSEYLGHELKDEDEVNLQRARLVAPNKLYYCASFRLPAAVAFGESETC